jgi:hypothetical protein
MQASSQNVWKSPLWYAYLFAERIATEAVLSNNEKTI